MILLFFFIHYFPQIVLNVKNVSLYGQSNVFWIDNRIGWTVNNSATINNTSPHGPYEYAIVSDDGGSAECHLNTAGYPGNKNNSIYSAMCNYRYMFDKYFRHDTASKVTLHYNITLLPGSPIPTSFVVEYHFRQNNLNMFHFKDINMNVPLTTSFGNQPFPNCRGAGGYRKYSQTSYDRTLDPTNTSFSGFPLVGQLQVNPVFLYSRIRGQVPNPKNYPLFMNITVGIGANTSMEAIISFYLTFTVNILFNRTLQTTHGTFIQRIIDWNEAYTDQFVNTSAPGYYYNDTIPLSDLIIHYKNSRYDKLQGYQYFVYGYFNSTWYDPGRQTFHPFDITNANIVVNVTVNLTNSNISSGDISAQCFAFILRKDYDARSNALTIPFKTLPDREIYVCPTNFERVPRFLTSTLLTNITLVKTHWEYNGTSVNREVSNNSWPTHAFYINITRTANIFYSTDISKYLQMVVAREGIQRQTEWVVGIVYGTRMSGGRGYYTYSQLDISVVDVNPVVPPAQVIVQVQVPSPDPEPQPLPEFTANTINTTNNTNSTNTTNTTATNTTSNSTTPTSTPTLTEPDLTPSRSDYIPTGEPTSPTLATLISKCILGVQQDGRCVKDQKLQNNSAAVVSMPNIVTYLQFLSPFLRSLSSFSYFSYHQYEYSRRVVYLFQYFRNLTQGRWVPPLFQPVLDSLNFSYKAYILNDDLGRTPAKYVARQEDIYFLKNSEDLWLSAFPLAVLQFLAMHMIHRFAVRRKYLKFAAWLTDFSTFGILYLSLFNENLEYIAFRTFQQSYQLVPLGNVGILNLVLCYFFNFMCLLTVAWPCLTCWYCKDNYEHILGTAEGRAPRRTITMIQTTLMCGVRFLSAFANACLYYSPEIQIRLLFLCKLLYFSISFACGFSYKFKVYKVFLMFGFVSQIALHILLIVEIQGSVVDYTVYEDFEVTLILADWIFASCNILILLSQPIVQHIARIVDKRALKYARVRDEIQNMHSNSRRPIAKHLPQVAFTPLAQSVGSSAEAIQSNIQRPSQSPSSALQSGPREPPLVKFKAPLQFRKAYRLKIKSRQISKANLLVLK